MPAQLGLSAFSLLSLIVLMVVYTFLITEKLNKVIVAMLGAAFLILMQVFRTSAGTSQENALGFISHNLDILGFVIGMMVLVGIVRESGAFEAAAIWLVKLVKGNPIGILLLIGLLTLVMTIFLSNIPTILILTPVLLVLIKQLNLPFLPYFFVMVTVANIAGAATPISDPTTYYQAKTVGLTFAEVVQNSGVIVLVLVAVSLLYVYLVFGKALRAVVVKPSEVALFKPLSAIRDKRVLWRGLPLLILTILLMVLKDPIRTATGISLDNATLTLGSSFLAMMIFHRDPKVVFQRLIDWEIIFFFIGLFVVVGALEFTQVISMLGQSLVKLSGGNLIILTGLITMGSGVLSTFIDNVPYNITMVGAIKAMSASGVWVYPLWWALNLGTSVGGAGSPIAAACNVVAFGQAEREKLHINFLQYLKLGLPLVMINSLVTFVIIWWRYLI